MEAPLLHGRPVCRVEGLDRFRAEGGYRGWLSDVIERLRASGLVVPQRALVDLRRPRVPCWSTECPPTAAERGQVQLWDNHGVETGSVPQLIDDVISFGEAACSPKRWLSDGQAVARARPEGPKPERRCVLALSRVDGRRGDTDDSLPGVPIAVFTTHATAAGAVHRLERRKVLDSPPCGPGREADRYNVRCQHQIERAC